ncbi:hypothetical protein L1987_02845 [Smallanthus sonchifolius]|uniref:Uncharacterized protein n=1 Tax=Smallanthus sonchifolius TaxID=185202 RepID=A0ACB9K8U7_9ASTR|nr:hypothetical protein L1987_02845 [Smallanthus sonchifolius]
MNSIFSSFDALSAEFLGKSVNYFNTKSPAAPDAGTIRADQKKSKHETTLPRNSARWAPEFDGLHCFESLVFH